MSRSGRENIPAVPPQRIADPTGVGDAFRAGFMKGLALGAGLDVCGRLGSVAAAYTLEHVGAQSHAYTWPEFVRRYEHNFGPLVIQPEGVHTRAE
jgi:adenosine kinase